MTDPHKICRLKDFDDLNEELDFLFSNYYKSRRPVLMTMDKGWRPQTDMYETADEIVIIMEIAGITTRDVSLKLDGKVLTLRGIRRERCGEKRRYHTMEIDYGPFERRLELPAKVDPERVVARFLQGFLEIKLVKVQSAPTLRKNIAIK